MKIRCSVNILAFSITMLFLSIGMGGCIKSNAPSGPAPGSSTITDILKNATDATLFYSSMTRVHLDTVFSGAGPFTVFVPVDNAFAAAGISSSILDNLSSDSLKNLMLYHTLAANLLSGSFPTEPNAKIITANGDSVFVTRNSNGVYINGVQALSADIIANNGVIDAMSGVLFPATGNLLQTIQKDTLFTYLVAALSRASQGSTDINGLLSYGGPYTLIAPVNNAFRTAGFATVDDINYANADSLANIMWYHIIPYRMFTSDIGAGLTKTTLNDSTISFTSVGSNRQIQGKSNTTPANVVAANIMATNGVLFVSDQLLMP